MNAAQLLRQLRKHERECQWSCATCQAKLLARYISAQRQRDAEEQIARLLREQS